MNTSNAKNKIEKLALFCDVLYALINESCSIVHQNIQMSMILFNLCQNVLNLLSLADVYLHIDACFHLRPKLQFLGLVDINGTCAIARAYKHLRHEHLHSIMILSCPCVCTLVRFQRTIISQSTYAWGWDSLQTCLTEFDDLCILCLIVRGWGNNVKDIDLLAPFCHQFKHNCMANSRCASWTRVQQHGWKLLKH